MKNEILQQLKGRQKVTDKIYNNLYPPGLSPRILYGLSIMQLTIADGVPPPFYPILSDIGTPT